METSPSLRHIMNRPRRECRKEGDLSLSRLADEEYRYHTSFSASVNSDSISSNEAEFLPSSNTQKRRRSIAIPSSPISVASDTSEDSDLSFEISETSFTEEKEKRTPVKRGSPVKAVKKSRGIEDTLYTLSDGIAREDQGIEAFLRTTDRGTNAANVAVGIVEQEKLSEPVDQIPLLLQESTLPAAKSKSELLDRAIRMPKDPTKINGRTNRWFVEVFFESEEEIRDKFFATLTTK